MGRLKIGELTADWDKGTRVGGIGDVDIVGVVVVLSVNIYDNFVCVLYEKLMTGTLKSLITCKGELNAKNV